MPAPIVSRRDIEFFLYEMFDIESLTTRERYQDHDRESFDAAIDIAQAIAEKYYLPIQSKVDRNEPTFDGNKVHIIPEIKAGLDAVIAAGLTAPTTDYEMGGMQLPQIAASGAFAYLSAAASTSLGYLSLTHANCNLIEAYGSPEQIEKWVTPQREGRFFGTMAMTEPGAGSGLGDLTTFATKEEDGTYRVKGNKIWISGGDHDLSENIVHLVLARVKGAARGVKGISLFIVPKFLVNNDGTVGQRNEVALAGLFHKMGGRGHTSTALSFGEQDGAVAYLVGEENKGLMYMFHMMNEARILVGTGAALTALTGFQYSLDYAKGRPQGRLLSSKDPLAPPVNIIEHPDVRRMLLTQKAYSEGAYALCLYGHQLADDEKTAPTESEKKHASTILNFLTPIIKSWPSEWGPKSNDLAIQVLGGHGYVNEHPVEMFYRDNRLNPIHEGTTGIQSLDLLCRKVPMNDFKGYQAFLTEMYDTVDSAQSHEKLQLYAQQLKDTLDNLKAVTTAVLDASKTQNIDMVFSNSVSYLNMFGHITIAWLWLRQAEVASKALDKTPHSDDEKFYNGKIQAMKYFFNSELPLTYHWGNLVKNIDSASFDTHPDWL
ncbi:acyl-CoA dehydrogenase [Paraglaciecola psychrophila]|uniref:Acyl-CoA dehydrogenase domain-containing protein n=1 Tax=Paraglaciecola psychrophila 170 TaxID=1129794 RepID=K6Z264_9ALTE|nr:acyl-CoA dehydrogenase [Paraglaciecola psychrophila]AGH46531.1 acyl-CoA dehydrogenase domain-containing protein [Paraglaciecola psychrophila 170]GAC39139.1 acyl-CoA dehydrogenase family protein [Paraglaciecola psychrophila 170]